MNLGEPRLDCGSSLPQSRPEARLRRTSRQQAGVIKSGSKLSKLPHSIPKGRAAVAVGPKSLYGCPN